MLRRVTVVLLSTGLALPGLATELIVGPYLQAPRPDGVVVAWETDQPSAGAVLVQTEGAAVARIDARGVATHHEVALRGLAPRSPHRYRVLVDGLPLGEPGLFVTLPPPGAPFSFVVFGDTRSDHAAHAACIRSGWATRTSWCSTQRPRCCPSSCAPR
jgi:hypothetical protein